MRLRLRRRRRAVSPALAAELEREPRWMYPWQLGDRTAPLLGPELPDVHRTRAEMIEGPVRAALAAAGRRATALDLACCEGWFSHRLLEWGASRVVGIDVREVNIRRAELVRDHLGVAPDRLELRVGDIYDLDPDELGTFDVVLLLGLVYHVEDPVGAVRRARAATRSLCVVESQLTRQREAVEFGWGQSDVVLSTDASFAAYREVDSATNPLTSEEGVLSLIPNAAALELTVRAAGFADVEWLEPRDDHNLQYRRRDRGIVVGRVRAH